VAVKHPAQPHPVSLFGSVWGALSVPKKKRLSPEVAAFRTANLCSSRFATGRQ